MAWTEDFAELRSAGFSDDEIAQEGARLRQEMTDSGFESKEIDEYFGIKEPDMTPVKNMIQENLKAMVHKEGQPETADSFIEAIEAGFKMSSGYMVGSALKGKSVTPDILLPEDAPTFHRIASQVGTLAGDFPAIVAGTFMGGSAGAAAAGAAGSVVPVAGTAAGAAVGAVVGGGAGGNALPAAIREVLTQYYEKGEIKDFSDFWERSSAVFVNTLKEGVIGGASAGVGGKVAGTLIAKGVAPTATRIASTSSEIATMVAVGKGFEGQVPTAQDFIDAGLTVGTLHLGAKTVGKFHQIYAKTGVTPAEVAQEAMVNPVVKQELLTNADGIPKIYDEMAKAEASIQKPDTTNVVSEAPVDTTNVVTPEAPLTPIEKILSKVGEKAETPKKSYTKDDFYKDYVDRLDPIKKAVEDLGADASGLTAEGNPYKLARMANDYKAKVQHFFEAGTLDYKTLEKTGKSFNEIIEPHKAELGDLKAYLISKRAIDLESRGIQSGFDIDAAREVVANGVKFEKAAKEITDFQNNALKYLKDSGIISPAAYSKMLKANENYVSFKRISEAGTVSKGSSKNPVKKIKGSDLAIQDPFISMIENTEMYLKLAEKNRAINSLVELAGKSSNQELIKKVPTSMKPIEVRTDEIIRALEDQGAIVTRDSVKRSFKEKGMKVPDEVLDRALESEQLFDADTIEAFTIFRENQQHLGPDEFEVFRNGKREVYKTEPALAEAIKVLDGNAPAQNIVFKIAQGITGLKRTLISITPDFTLRNFFRDQVTTGVYTKGGTIPFFDTVVAMGDIISKNETYYNWLKSGGANGAFLELGQKYLDQKVYDLDAETNFTKATWNLISKPFHMLQLAGTLTEQATRLAEAKKAMRGKSSGPEIFDAGFASREATIDFQRVGAKVSAINAITAFANAQVQGLDRSLRSFKDDPTGFAMRAGMWITAPSVLLWWANHDDERVKEIPRWQKDMFWIIPTDDWVPESVPGEAEDLPAYLVREGKDGKKEINKGTVYRLPKPQELGVLFGSVPERVLEAFFTENPDSMKDFGKTLSGLFTPNVLPDAVAPIMEQWANKSNFTDGKLVPSHLEGILPQYQYTDYTTDTAKALGKMVMAVPFIGDAGPKNTPLSSPMVLENYVRSWGGSTGMYALQIADAALEKAGLAPVENKPASTLSDVPFVKAFIVRHPSANTNSIRDFEESFERNERYLKTLKALDKQGNFEESELLRNDPANQERLMSLQGIHEAIMNQGRMIQTIYRDPEMLPDEKRQLIDGLYFGMTETAKMGNEIVREFEKEINEQKKVQKENNLGE